MADNLLDEWFDRMEPMLLEAPQGRGRARP